MLLNKLTEWVRSEERTGIRRRRRAAQAGRLRVEALEDRCVPANLIITVNSAADDPFGAVAGVVTLRDAIDAVNSDAGDLAGDPDIIRFAIPGSPTITLSADLPAITNPVFIDGGSQPGVAIDGQASSGVNNLQGFAILIVNSAATETGVTFTNGVVTVNAGGSLSVTGDFTLGDAAGDNTLVQNYGHLSVSGSVVGGNNSGLSSFGAAALNVAGDFTLGNFGFLHNGLSSADQVTSTIGGSFSLGVDGFAYNYGRSDLSVGGNFTIGDNGFFYNGVSSTDQATFSVGGSFSIGTNSFVNNTGLSAFSVTGDFTLGDGGDLSNGADFSSADTATFNIGGSFAIGANGSIYNDGTSIITVRGDFTLGDGDFLYNGVLNSDAATLAVGGNFSLGVAGGSNSFLYDVGASTLDIAGNFALGGADSFLYVGQTNADTATFTLGGNFTLDAGNFFAVYGTMSVSGAFDPGSGNADTNDTIAGTFIANSGSSVTTNSATWEVLAGGHLLVSEGASFDVAPSGALLVDGNAVNGVTVTDGGSGYTSPPDVVFSGTGTGAAAVATISGGVSSVTITDGGSGYASPPIVMFFGTGTGAKGVATVANGVVTGITITDPGSGYTSPPIVFIFDPTFSGFGASATATISGSVTSVTITNPGSGYSSPPSVSFLGGSGSDAAATAQITFGGLVTDEGTFTVEGTLSTSKLSAFVVDENGRLDTAGAGQLDVQGTLLIWNNPADITSTTPLGAAQLNATASTMVNGSFVTLPGTFTYTPASGSTLPVGQDQTLNVIFTPSDASNYIAASAHVSINVLPGGQLTPDLTINPVNITYGAALSNSQLSGTATVTVDNQVISVEGTFTFTSAVGTILNAGAGQIEDVTFTPIDTVHYTSAYGTVIVNVSKADQTITLTQAPPAYAVFGDSFFVSATASSGLPVAIAAGGAGAGGGVDSATITITQSTGVATITFSQSGNANYNSATKTVTVQVVSPGVWVIGSELWYVGTTGAHANDQVRLDPYGASNTGSTGLVLNRKVYDQSFTAFRFYGYGGNDNIRISKSLMIDVYITGGNGNDNIQAGDNNNTIVLGDGNNNIQLGDGNNVIVTGNGNDSIVVGDGNNLIAAGLGRHTVRAGNGSNILIDGSVQLTQAGDSLRQVLDDWIEFGALDSNVASIRERLQVTYNTHYANTLEAGSGLDWFWYTFPNDLTNRKASDLLN